MIRLLLVPPALIMIGSSVSMVAHGNAQEKITGVVLVVFIIAVITVVMSPSAPDNYTSSTDK